MVLALVEKRSDCYDHWTLQCRRPISWAREMPCGPFLWARSVNLTHFIQAVVHAFPEALPSRATRTDTRAAPQLPHAHPAFFFRGTASPLQKFSFRSGQGAPWIFKLLTWRTKNSSELVLPLPELDLRAYHLVSTRSHHASLLPAEKRWDLFSLLVAVS